MKLTAGTVTGIILGVIATHLTRRYLPAILWWVWTTDTRRHTMTVEQLVSDQADPRKYICTECTREYPSHLAAEDCREQDLLEADDRTHGRLYGIHRGLD